MEDPLYEVVNGRPELIDSVVLFVDILGSKEMADSEDPQEVLERLYGAVNSAETLALGVEKDAPRVVKTFTDNIVIGWPIQEWEWQSAIESILTTASHYQHELARHGFFVRGGLDCGLLYMDENFAFGPGLVAAVRLESQDAIYPRIILGDRAVDLTLDHLAHELSDESWANDMLVFSSDERVILNYLHLVDQQEDPAIAQSLLVEHKERVEEALKKYSGKMRVWEKYRWLADYHDYICSSRHDGFGEVAISQRPSGDPTATSFMTFAEAVEQHGGARQWSPLN